MKKILLLFVSLVIIIELNAQTSDKKWGVGAGVGAYGTTNKSSIGFMPELYLSRYLSPKLDLMFKTDVGIFNSKVSNTLDITNFFLNARYKLTDETKNFRPYLYAGPGYLSDNGGTGVNFDLGAGAKYYVKPNAAFYLEAGYINGIDTKVLGVDTRDNFWKATLGFEFDFGKTKDSDKDGVPDRKDKCPNTPAGVAVDANGCPLDTDGDGVPDYIDDCPTVPGLASLKGCPDSDGDGVADKDDKCPDTPKGWKVDAKGCPLDSDGDGVPDAIDKCPDTPKGWKVDANGCPLDTDGDGVPDAIDDCPTVPGPKENKGCPVKEITAQEIEAQKMVVDPVYFDFDKANYINNQKVKIEKLVNLLKENKSYKVNISGFTDEKGTDAYNMELSKRRISSVLKTILASGIKKSQIAAEKPMGRTKPASTNNTDEGRALNRRVEFEVIQAK